MRRDNEKKNTIQGDINPLYRNYPKEGVRFTL
jgi:hypothetical protein